MKKRRESAHIPPCDVETNGGDCSCADTWRARAEDLARAFYDLDALIDTASRWLNDSTQWEGDDYLSPQFQKLRDRVAALATGQSGGAEDGGHGT